MWFVFPGVIYIVVTSKKKKASQAAFANWQRKANTRIAQILQEAERCSNIAKNVDKSGYKSVIGVL